jgi:hypothetical protein
MSDCKCCKCEALIEKGRRLERRALKLDASKANRVGGLILLGEERAVIRQWVGDWLSHRTKPAKRKEGGSGR